MFVPKMVFFVEVKAVARTNVLAYCVCVHYKVSSIYFVVIEINLGSGPWGGGGGGDVCRAHASEVSSIILCGKHVLELF